MRTLRGPLLLVLLLSIPVAARALVSYDQGARVVKGVQLLQDATDPKIYYYVPQTPRLAQREDGTFEFLCMKYVNAQGGTNGGLFHALVEFTVPAEQVADAEKALRQAVPDAHIQGPVQLMQADKNGEDGVGAFEVVSAVLSDKGEGGFTRSVVTSGRAPLMPGSKAVVAALLKQDGATLLWNSLSGPTSDVSVAIHAYYEAAVKGYNARITADVSTVYDHFSQVGNSQKEYSKRQVRDIVDNLQRTGTLKVEVVDRSAGLGIKGDDMEGVLKVVTDKLVEVMFDHKTGWSADPERETAVDQNQLKGRQEGGFLDKLLFGEKNEKYFTDDQLVLKKRKDIRQNTFVLTLDKTTTIKVPLDTAGNLHGLYSAMGADARYFRIVNLADPAFEFRPVYFQLDGDYLDSFSDAVNFVSVNVRKRYPKDQPAFTKTLQFTRADVDGGKATQKIEFPRLGMADANWTQFEYQLRWALRDGPTLQVPRQADEWATSSDAAISLAPPLTKRIVEIDADRQLFTQRGVSTATIEFATVIAGKPRLQRKAILRAADASSNTKVSVYADPGTPVAYRVSWHSASGDVTGKLDVLETDYLFLTPPSDGSAAGTAPGGGR